MAKTKKPIGWLVIAGKKTWFRKTDPTKDAIRSGYWEVIEIYKKNKGE